MNILVTGANGFIGSNIVSKLSTNLKFNVFKGTRDTIDLLSSNGVQKYIENNNINSVIHCAIEGGSRLKKDDGEMFYRNILMYENLIKFKSHYKLFINLASGAEFDRNLNIDNRIESDIFNSVPKDYYGLAKNIISKSVRQFEFGHNFRIFGCFYHNELDTRFIKNNIKNYINKKPISIHQDKYMDYIYLDDLYTIIEHYLANPPYKSTDINMSYIKKYKLSDIANIINNLDSHKVDINIENENLGFSYTGSSNSLISLGIKLKELEIGIEEIYGGYKFNVLH